MAVSSETSKSIKSIMAGRGKNSESGEYDINSAPEGYEYLTGIVKEVINDPDLDALSNFQIRTPGATETEPQSLLTFLSKNTSNPALISVMPRNSAVVYIIDKSQSKKGAKPFICFPFFPPHISLPLKPGEHVWILREASAGIDNYYWLCRKHGTKHVDDVNYTIADRAGQVDFFLKQKIEGKITTISDLQARTAHNFNETADPNLPKDNDNREDLNTIIANSIAYSNNFTQEVVPSFIKKCGDTSLQGSNNTLIHLTTEKFEKTGGIPTNAFQKIAESEVLTSRDPFSPAIDICVARKKTELLEIIEASSNDILESSNGSVAAVLNSRGDNYELFETYERNKTTELMNTPYSNLEGIDEDPLNCGARMYMSNDCNVDSVFKTTLPDAESFSTPLPNLGGSSIVTYANNNRIVANNDIRLTNFIGESYVSLDEDGLTSMQSRNIKEHAVEQVLLENDENAYLKLLKDGNVILHSDKSRKCLKLIESADEPFVIYSALVDLLTDICYDLTALNRMAFLFGKAAEALESLAPPLGAAIETAQIDLRALDALDVLNRPTLLFGENAKITIRRFPTIFTTAFGHRSTPGTLGSDKIYGKK